MWRNLHSLPGIFSLLLIACLAVSGAMLAFFPVRNDLAAEVQPTNALSVADAVAAVTQKHADIDTLTRTPSGSLVLNYFDAEGMPQRGFVDVRSGAILRPVAQGPSFYGSLKTFHRSLFLNEWGRWVAAFGAAMLAFLSLSGLFLMAARMGGWTRLFDRPRGNWSARIHTILARLAIVPLVLSACTGIYIALAEFAIIPVTKAEPAAFRESAPNMTPVAPGSLHGLAEIPLSSLRVLTFPIPGDSSDIFTARTNSGILLIDQANGDVLERVPYTVSERAYGWIYAMHTGVGMAWMGVILALASLSVPAIGLTGVAIWLKRTRGGNRRIKGNAPAALADIVVLVGSESGATWGFARSLHRDATASGFAVHVAPMNAYGDHYPNATALLFLTSTHGNGSAPGTADRFLQLLARQERKPFWSFAVLGFGDRAFPQFCKFAKDLDLELESHGWKRLLRPAFINRQSTQAFANWGNELAAALNSDFKLSHAIQLPKTRRLTLVERRVYGTEVQAPTAVLKFSFDGGGGSSFLDRIVGRDGKYPRFAPGDLLGVVPPSGTAPRFYSVSSLPSNTEVEICVRKRLGGECSTYLHELEIGGRIECFVRSNPDFRPSPGQAPVIMIGAGTGIAPFMGMIRDNRRRRDIHLFWGGRDPSSDFLYEDTLKACREDGRLTTLATAFSRTGACSYVQDRLREEAGHLREMLRCGASIMVCGGDEMARAVMAEIDAVLMPLHLSVARLKQHGQYFEEVF
ncbi:MAG: PepSY domain-containing protein [Paracoccaceae bacterium]